MHRCRDSTGRGGISIEARNRDMGLMPLRPPIRLLLPVGAKPGGDLQRIRMLLPVGIP